MFEFLKNKLKGAISKLSEKIKESVEEPEENLPIKEEKPIKKEPKKEEKRTEKRDEEEEKLEEKPSEIPEKKSFFQKIRESFSKKEEEKQQEKEEEPEREEKHKEKKGISEEKEEEKKERRAEEKKEEYHKKEKPEEKQEKRKEEKHEEKIESAKEKTQHTEKKEEKQEERHEEKKPAEKEKYSERENAPEIKAEIKKEKEEEPAERKSIFSRISDAFTKKSLSKEQFEQIFWELEVVLMENNVAVEVIDKIKSDLESEIVDKPLKRSSINETIEDALRKSIESLFDVEKIDFVKAIRAKKPFVILFLGINGSGKTTTVAKITNLLIKNHISCVLAAADTFRAAAIDQLEEHAKKLGVKLVKHQYGADSAAVAFDAVKYAEAHGIDAVLIDTAGRMHSNSNLMQELKKITRVANPDMKIFIGEAITGNDCVEQARSFNEAVGIDAIVLAKADIDEKGGAAISVSYVTKKPIIYLGVGQKYENLEEFNSGKIIKSIGL